MEMPSEQHTGSVYDAVTIKQEPLEMVPDVSLNQEIEYVSVKEEGIPCPEEWEVPNGCESTQDPLSIVKVECPPSEDFPWPSAYNIVKTEDEEQEEEPGSEDGVEECSPSEDFPRPSTSNIDKTEDEEQEEESGGSEDDVEEVRHEVESRSVSSEAGSNILVGVECDAGTNNSSSLVTRQGVACGNEVPVKDLLLRCTFCKKTFTWYQDLKEHTQVVRPEDVLYCSVCHKKLKKRDQLKKLFHLLKVGRPYSCGVCNKAFARPDTLNRHLRLHSGERPYRCGICNKTFINSSSLYLHSWLHSGERPNKCGVCNKTFIRNDRLKRHSRMHMS